VKRKGRERREGGSFSENKTPHTSIFLLKVSVINASSVQGSNDLRGGSQKEGIVRELKTFANLTALPKLFDGSYQSQDKWAPNGVCIAYHNEGTFSINNCRYKHLKRSAEEK